MPEITIEQYLEHGLDALKQRKSYLIHTMQTTTNPVEKLSCIDRIEEIENAVTYFRDYAQVLKTNVNK